MALDLDVLVARLQKLGAPKVTRSQNQNKIPKVFGLQTIH